MKSLLIKKYLKDNKIDFYLSINFYRLKIVLVTKNRNSYSQNKI